MHKKKKQNIVTKSVLSLLILIMVICYCPISTLADENNQTVTETTITSPTGVGRKKKGTTVSFKIQAKTGEKITEVKYQWDRHINPSYLPSTYEKIPEEEQKDVYERTLQLPFEEEGIHELSVIAKDSSGKMTKWKDYSYFIVNSDVEDGYTDTTRVAYDTTQSGYPASGTTIKQGEKIRITVIEENGIYLFKYKWTKGGRCTDYNQFEKIYNPHMETPNVIEIDAPEEIGNDWYLEYYAYDGYSNAGEVNELRVSIADLTPPEVKLNGDSEITLNVGETFTDEGAEWEDNTDENYTLYLNDPEIDIKGQTVDTSRPGVTILKYSKPDAAGNPSNVVERKVTVLGNEPIYNLIAPNKFYINQPIDYSEFKMEIIATDGSVTYDAINPDLIFGLDVEDKDMLDIEQDGCVVYNDEYYDFTYIVTDKVVSIKVKEVPDRTFEYGDELDLTGGTLVVTMASGSTKDVDLSEATIGRFDPYTVKAKSLVVVSYEGVQASCYVQVTKRNIDVEIDSTSSMFGDKLEKLTWRIKRGYVIEKDDTTINPLGIVLTKEDGDEAGTYDITGSFTNLTNCYNVNFTNGKYTIIDYIESIDLAEGASITGNYGTELADLTVAGNLTVNYASKGAQTAALTEATISVPEGRTYNPSTLAEQTLLLTYGTDKNEQPVTKEVTIKLNEVAHNYEIKGIALVDGPTPTATVSYACQNTGCEYETVHTLHATSITVLSTTATCSQKGTNTYTVTYRLPGEESDRTATVVGDEGIAEKLPHTYGELIPQEDATCTETGKKAHYECSECHKLFNESKVEVTNELLVIAALGHNTAGTVDHVDATCIEPGVVGGTYCTRCENGKAAAEAEIEALGHSYPDATTVTINNDGTATVVLTCTREGCTEETTDHVKTITVDEEEKIVKTTVTTPTCTAKGKDHYVVTYQNPSKEESTVETDVETPINADAHNWNSATWEWEDDYSEATITITCENNPEHKEIATVKSTRTEIIKEANCTEDGQAKYRVEYTFNQTPYSAEEVGTIESLGHSMTKVTAEPETCTEDGHYEYYQCNKCGKVFKDKYGDVETTIEAETIAATGHDIVTDEGRAATCTEPGLTEGSHCTKCDDATVAQTEIPAKGHNYSKDLAAWTWLDGANDVNGNATYEGATLVLTCSNDSTHTIDVAKESITLEKTLIKAPTGYETGILRYSVAYLYEGIVYQDSKDVTLNTVSTVFPTLATINMEYNGTTVGTLTMPQKDANGNNINGTIEVNTELETNLDKKLTVGTHTINVTYRPTDTTKTPAIGTLTVVVAQGTPDYTIPTSVTATYGQTIANIKSQLDGTGFTFEAADNTSVGNAGNNTFKVTYTPDDTDNYKTVTGLNMTVKVEKAKYTLPESVNFEPATFEFDGAYHSVEVTGLPTGVSVTYSPNNSQWEEGSYDIVATFELSNELKKNYSATEPLTMSAELIIRKVQSIRILTAPTAENYGDSLDFTNAKLEVTKTDGTVSTIDITSDMIISGTYSPTTTTEQTVSVTYGGKTTTFKVTLQDEISYITATNTGKTTYKYAENINTDQITVIGHTRSGNEITLTDRAKINGTYNVGDSIPANQEGTFVLEITCEGCRTQLNITVETTTINYVANNQSGILTDGQTFYYLPTLSWDTTAEVRLDGVLIEGNTTGEIGLGEHRLQIGESLIKTFTVAEKVKPIVVNRTNNTITINDWSTIDIANTTIKITNVDNSRRPETLQPTTTLQSFLNGSTYYDLVSYLDTLTCKKIKVEITITYNDGTAKETNSFTIQK